MANIRSSTVSDCGLIQLPKVHNRAGNLTALNGGKDFPMKIERIFYLYDVPGGESRGGHAHKLLHQYLIAGSGSFDVVLSDGKQRKKISLNRPDVALYIAPGIWGVEENFSSGAICLVLASEKYDESDYIRDYSEFLAFKK